MVDIYNASLADILPQSLKIDSQFVAIAEALTPILQKVAYDSRKAMHLPRLDELEGLILDVLAEQFHVDNFDSVNLTDAQKRNFIRNSIAQHRIKGTVAAVENVVNQFFAESEVVELEGFRFRVRAREFTAADDALDTFFKMIMDAKPVRSWFMGVDFDLSPPPNKIFVGNPVAAIGAAKVDYLKPQPLKINLRAGVPMIITGKILIGG